MPRSEPCATSSDLQKLNQGIHQNLQAQSRTVRVEIGALRDEVRALRAEAEGLRAQMGTLQQDTNGALARMREDGAVREQILSNLSTMAVHVKNEVESYGATASKQLSNMEEWTGATTKEIQAIRTNLSGFHERLDQLPSIVSALGQQVQSLTDTFWGSYEVEETGLRNRLRALEVMKKRLSPLAAHQPTSPDQEK